MNKVTFLKLLNLVSNIENYLDKLENLGIITESPIINEFYSFIDSVIIDSYGLEGLQWVQWWIYEKSKNPELKAYETDENGERIEIIKTVDELYEYLEIKNNVNLNRNERKTT